ncbi:MAG TPA: hypothetical protein VNN77_10315 [candidate division Zixibacteria bacterium]|nr:hypothetical protein [candidate division Zixibacteria bacterium]
MAGAAVDSKSAFKLWEGAEPGFGDFLDVLNPLHHIPVVATIYRKMTGDRIAPAARVVGGALWGRIGGFVMGIVNSIVEWFTGKDVGDHLLSWFTGLSSGPVYAGAGHAAAPEPGSSAGPALAAVPLPARARQDGFGEQEGSVDCVEAFRALRSYRRAATQEMLIRANECRDKNSKPR